VETMRRTNPRRPIPAGCARMFCSPVVGLVASQNFTNAMTAQQ
jgi:hypothetical protein